MGKLIRNGIEYGGGNGTDIFKVTQAEYDALVQAGTLVHNALYVISDAPNLNPTASDIEYSSGVTVKQAIDSKQPLILQTTISGTTDGTGDLSLTGLPITQYRVLSCIKVRNTANPDVAYCVLGGYSTGTNLPYAHLINSSNANYSNKAVELTVNYIAI